MPPSIRAVGHNEDTSNTSSPLLVMPSGAVLNNWLIALVSVDGGPTVSNLTGFTVMGELAHTGGNNKLSIWRKKAAGGDSGFNYTFSTPERAITRVIEVQGADPDVPPELSTFVSDNTTTPDPPSFTPSFTAGFWVALYGSNANSGSLATAYPTNYSLNQFTTATGSSNAHVGLGMAARQISAATENPSAFTIQNVENHIACVIAFKDAPAGGSLIFRPRGLGSLLMR